MNAIAEKERAGTMFGVEGRFFNVVRADNGRILNQTFKARRDYREDGHAYAFTVTARFDDECRNGHETFAITADIREDGREYMGGCCHDEIAARFPELAPLIRWHLVSTDGPMHYVANTVYHADEHGPTHASPGYRVEWDAKTIKTRNLDHARSCAVWPEATDAELCAPDLKDKLLARLPALMTAFKADMIAAGFIYP